MGKMLGADGKVSTHLDNYTPSFKSLITDLTDQNINYFSIGKVDTFMQNDSVTPNVEKFTGTPSQERKEKLKVQVMNESQRYYQNNLNMFSNGLSLLSVNSLETHQKMKEYHTQRHQISKLSQNILVHNNFMRKKTKESIRELKKAL